MSEGDAEGIIGVRNNGEGASNPCLISDLIRVSHNGFSILYAILYTLYNAKTAKGKWMPDYSTQADGIENQAMHQTYFQEINRPVSSAPIAASLPHGQRRTWTHIQQNSHH